MNEPITWKGAAVFFISWQILDGLKQSFGMPSAYGAAIAMLAVAYLGYRYANHKQ